MTTEAKVGAFVLGCFAILAFTLIYLINAQFSGDTVPTHDRAEPTWYVGVNLQATLFKTIFGALLGDNDKNKEGGSK